MEAIIEAAIVGVCCGIIGLIVGRHWIMYEMRKRMYVDFHAYPGHYWRISTGNKRVFEPVLYCSCGSAIRSPKEGKAYCTRCDKKFDLTNDQYLEQYVEAIGWAVLCWHGGEVKFESVVDWSISCASPPKSCSPPVR